MIESFLYVTWIGGQALFWLILKYQTEILGEECWLMELEAPNLATAPISARQTELSAAETGPPVSATDGSGGNMEELLAFVSEFREGYKAFGSVA